MELVKHEVPKLQDLLAESEDTQRQTQLTVILNQEPPQKWLLEHPMAKIPYLPISRVEYLLTKIYGRWNVEVKDVKVLANSVCVTVRLFVTNPLTGQVEFNDGVGAAPIQTDSGKGAMDWNFAKSSGVQIAAPAAETYAIKDAAEKFGKIFGRDLGRKQTMDYATLLTKQTPKLTYSDLWELYQMKKSVMLPSEIKAAERILDKANPEEKSFATLQKILAEK